MEGCCNHLLADGVVLAHYLLPMPKTAPVVTDPAMLATLLEAERLRRKRLVLRQRNLKSRMAEMQALYEEQLRAQMQMLQQTTEFLTEVQAQLEERTNDILESVRYGRYIQNAIMPQSAELQALLPDSFVLYQPRDIISGDLPWVRKYGDSILAAAMDCTGHGVPGAMIAMLGYSLLNEVVTADINLHPSQILARLNDLVVKSFSHTAGAQTVQDGMDIALLQYYPQQGRIVFAGAKRPLFLVQDGTLTEGPSVDHSIGYPVSPEVWYDQEYAVRPGDTIYLFSDGMVDQFGQQTGKKFLKSRLRNLCLEASALPANQQLQRFEQAFADWKGSLRQTDDVLLLGIRVS